MDAKSSEASPAPTRSGRGGLRFPLAILAGIVTMMLGVALYQGLFLMLPMYLRDAEMFSRMMELAKDPEAMREAYEAGTIPKLGTFALCLTLGADSICAALGTMVAVRIAGGVAWKPALTLAVIMIAWTLFYTLTNELEAILPTWVPWTRALFAMPLGFFCGGWWCHQR